MQVSRTTSLRKGSCTGAIGELSKWGTARDQDGNRKQILIRFSPEIYVMKGVIDGRVNKLYTLATQDGDAILSPNGKTRVFQRNDLLKVPLNTPKTVFILK